MILFFVGCGNAFQYEDFVPNDPARNAKQFSVDSAQCELDQDKHSSKIRGRELGFRGEHAAYLGCMQVRGWNRKTG